MKNNDLIQVTFTAEELTENNAHLDALLAFAGKKCPSTIVGRQNELWFDKRNQ